MRRYLRVEEALKNPIPPYVNWELTNRCNMGCPYCFLGEHPEGVLPDLPTNIVKEAIKKLKEGGARMLNYSGGEPLLRDDIIELIEYGHGLGLITILSTNGILLSAELIRELRDCLTWVTLPIDGPNAGIHDSVRGKREHFENVLDQLKIFESSGISLKVNTMLCKKNIAFVKDIADLLKRFKIRKWKLFQFSARGKAKKVREEYEIYDEDFLACRSKLTGYPFDVIFSTNEIRDNAYFLIGTDGKVHVPIGGEYVYLGDILVDSLESFRNSRLLDPRKNITNARVSYNLFLEDKMMARVNRNNVEPEEDPCGLRRDLYHSGNLSIAHFQITGQAEKHKHPEKSKSGEEREEIYYVEKGEGEIIVNGETLTLKEGDTYPVPKNSWHYLKKVEGKLFEVLVISHPEYDPDDFITEE